MQTIIDDILNGLAPIPPNPCKKTGANVFLTSHGGYLHGDMFLLEGVYYLRYVGDVQYGKDADHCDYVLDNDGLPGEICLMVGDTVLVHSRYVQDNQKSRG